MSFFSGNGHCVIRPRAPCAGPCDHRVCPSFSIPPLIVHQQSAKPASWELCPTLPHACTHSHTCACITMHTIVRACIMNISMHIHNHTHSYADTYRCSYVHMYIRTHNHAMHVHEHMPTHVGAHTCPHMWVLTHVHTCGYSEVCRCTHMSVCISNMHICKHAHTPIHIRNCRLSAGNLSSSEETLLVRQ